MTPKDKFSMMDGTEKSFIEYYKEVYNVEITDTNQPLLVNEPKKGRLKQIYLIPELCAMTGITDDQRKDRQFMESLSEYMKPDCKDRLAKSASFSTTLSENTATRDFMGMWGVKIGAQPLTLEATKLQSGNLLLGNNKKVDIDSCTNIDYETKNKMFSQTDINKLAVFYPARNKNDFNKFMTTMMCQANDYKIVIKSSAGFEVERDNDIKCWLEKAKKFLSKDVTAAIFLLNGPKGKSKVYPEIKRFLVNEAPVPSQMVMIKTMDGRNTKSIMNKILIQLNSKIGGIPWAIDGLPFSNKPTMIIGIDVFHKGAKSKPSVLSLVATMNNTFTKYFSCSVFTESDKEMGVNLQGQLKQALDNFYDVNGIGPENLFVYRDGIGPTKRNSTLETEKIALQAAIAEFIGEKYNEGKAPDET